MHTFCGDQWVFISTADEVEEWKIEVFMCIITYEYHDVFLLLENKVKHHISIM